MHVRWHERLNATDVKPEADDDTIVFPAEAVLEQVRQRTVAAKAACHERPTGRAGSGRFWVSFGRKVEYHLSLDYSCLSHQYRKA